MDQHEKDVKGIETIYDIWLMDIKNHGRRGTAVGSIVKGNIPTLLGKTMPGKCKRFLTEKVSEGRIEIFQKNH